MAGMTWRTLTVEAVGRLTVWPSKMFGETGAGIGWCVVHDSGVRVKLRIKDFKRKNTGNAIDPVDFFTDRVTVEAGDPPGMIVGQISFLPSSTPVLTKYTIEVKSSLLNKDYDPDLEIDRPPA